jgi:hypothetical protein
VIDEGSDKKFAYCSLEERKMFHSSNEISTIKYSGFKPRKKLKKYRKRSLFLVNFKTD